MLRREILDIIGTPRVWVIRFEPQGRASAGSAGGAAPLPSKTTFYFN
jgi:hypothetical protein